VLRIEDTQLVGETCGSYERLLGIYTWRPSYSTVTQGLEQSDGKLKDRFSVQRQAPITHTMRSKSNRKENVVIITRGINLHRAFIGRVSPHDRAPPFPHFATLMLGSS